MPIYYTKEEKKLLNRQRGIIVDPEDEWLLEEYLWTIGQSGYPIYTVDFGNRRAPTYLHHYIMGQPIWQSECIDHRNRIKLDNRRSNMRYATYSENRINVATEGWHNINVTVYGKYQVRIRRNDVLYYLGTFDTLDEAAAERDEWLAQYNKESA